MKSLKKILLAFPLACFCFLSSVSAQNLLQERDRAESKQQILEYKQKLEEAGKYLNADLGPTGIFKEITLEISSNIDSKDLEDISDINLINLHRNLGDYANLSNDMMDWQTGLPIPEKNEKSEKQRRPAPGVKSGTSQGGDSREGFIITNAQRDKGMQMAMRAKYMAEKILPQVTFM